MTRKAAFSLLLLQIAIVLSENKLVEKWLNRQNYDIHVILGQNARFTFLENDFPSTLMDTNLQLDNISCQNVEKSREKGKMSKLFYLQPFDNNDTIKMLQYLDR